MRPTTNTKALADLVLLHRAELGLSVSRAAQLAGINRDTWADLESADSRLPRPETLKAVAEVLGLDVRHLLIAGGIIDPPPVGAVSDLAETLHAILAAIDGIEARVRALEQPGDQTDPAGDAAPPLPGGEVPPKKSNRPRRS